ncbi:MAG: peptide chain release factor N(5)-glutamine methyltransferase [Anaerolineales bacterium]|nr:peptide chain release factor N(5)-glutamine methyltransferase [Anaerolineales bacterium]
MFTDSKTISQALQESTVALAPVSETARLDSEVWLAYVLGVERPWLLAHGEQELSEQHLADWQSGLQRLTGGEPLPYLLGHWEFYGLMFQVSPSVLIPRPETELLVDEALAWLRTHRLRTPGRAAADVGTGSAAIPVAIAANEPDVTFHAIDISPDALAIAQTNVSQHGLAERVHVSQGDLLAGFDAPLDLITANLPYIPSARVPTLTVAKWEPLLALDGGADGLELIRVLIQQAGRLLKPGGLFLEEIDPELEDSVEALARQQWPTAQVEVLADLTGRPRLLRVQLEAAK